MFGATVVEIGVRKVTLGGAADCDRGKNEAVATPVAASAASATAMPSFLFAKRSRTET